MWCNTINRQPVALIASIKKERPNAGWGVVMREVRKSLTGEVGVGR
ncbi:hypothetical protein [Limnohabitans sp. G3-2]|nr:hypothetical protein [Limnohabitans sp. G3-2]